MESVSQLFSTPCLWSSLIILLALSLFVGIPRIRMEIRAKKVLSQMPSHEIKSFFITFDPALSSGKRIIIDKKIAEMESQGWIYLKCSEANPLKTIKYRGGGLNMYFIRNSE
jgi:hypothetical protein